VLDRPIKQHLINQLDPAKVDCSGKRLMVCWKIWGFWNSFSYKIVLKTCKIPWGNPYSWGQLYGVPHGISRVFNTILYKNEFQNPQIFQQTISLFPEQSTLAKVNISFRGVDYLGPWSHPWFLVQSCTHVVIIITSCTRTSWCVIIIIYHHMGVLKYLHYCSIDLVKNAQI
jgi:hypothetical protein